MKIEVRESVELKLDDKKIVLTRKEAIELINALQEELGIPPKEAIRYYPYYPWWNQLPTVSIPSVWTGPNTGDWANGTVTTTASTNDNDGLTIFKGA